MDIKENETYLLKDISDIQKSEEELISNEMKQMWKNGIKIELILPHINERVLVSFLSKRQKKTFIIKKDWISKELQPQIDLK